MAIGRRSTLLLSVAALALPVALGACTPNEELKYSIKSPTGQPNESISGSNDADSGRLMRIARATEASGDLVAAASMYQRAAALSPKSPEPLLALADAYRELGLPENAEVTYRSVLALDANNLDAQRGLGASLIAMGRPEEARVIYEALIGAEPLDPRAHNGKGAALAMQQRHGEAQDAFRTGLRLAPDNVQLNNNLALSLVQSGRPSEAVPIFQKLAALPDAPARVRENLVLAMRAADSNPVDVATLDAPDGADSTGEASMPAAEPAKAEAPARPNKAIAAKKPEPQPKADSARATEPAAKPEAQKTSQNTDSSYEAISPSAGTPDVPEVIAYNPRDEESAQVAGGRLVDVEAEIAQADIDQAFDDLDKMAEEQAALDDVTMTESATESAALGSTPPGDEVTARASGVEDTENASAPELIALADEADAEPGEVILSEPKADGQRYAVIAAPRKATHSTAPVEPAQPDIKPVEPVMPKATVLSTEGSSIKASASAADDIKEPAPAASVAQASSEPDPVNTAELASIEPAGLAPATASDESSTTEATLAAITPSAAPQEDLPAVEPAPSVKQRLFRLQLSAESSEKNAVDKWNELTAQAPDLLGALSMRINQRADGASGPSYRLRTDPPMGEAEATSLCNKLKAKGIACFLSGIGRSKSGATASLDTDSAPAGASAPNASAN